MPVACEKSDLRQRTIRVHLVVVKGIVTWNYLPYAQVACRLCSTNSRDIHAFSVR